MRREIGHGVGRRDALKEDRKKELTGTSGNTTYIMLQKQRVSNTTEMFNVMRGNKITKLGYRRSAVFLAE